MKIEITKGGDNPVAEFFSSPSKTPETDAALYPMNVDIVGEIRLLEERIEEALKELSSIHQWIDRNHADGFIDSLTYFQNLERVTDNWYDRLDRLEVDAKRFVRERDEARHKLELCMAANSDVARIAKERDEARAEWYSLQDAFEDSCDKIEKLERERDEAREVASGLAQQAERLRNARELAKEADLGHDMAISDLTKCETELAEATTKLAEISSLTESIVEKANELIARWDQPSWKDTAPTARFINALRIAVRAYEREAK